MSLCDWNTEVEIIQRVLTSAAIVIGAIWTYAHYFRGRLYYPILNVSVSLLAEDRNDYRTVLVVSTLKNVGLSRVDPNSAASSIEIFGLSDYENIDFPLSANENYLAAYDVLEKEIWIEPGASVTTKKLLFMPKDESVGYSVSLRIVGRRPLLRRKSFEWEAMDAVYLATPDNASRVFKNKESP